MITSIKCTIKNISIVDKCIVVFLILVFTFNIRIVNVHGDSMNPTLETKDIMITYKMLFGPQQGDIVVFKKDHQTYVKRLIAIGGQVVMLKPNDDKTYSLYVDNILLEEEYITELINSGNIGNMSLQDGVTIPQGHVFVLGDNRNGSLDSRKQEIGFIETKLILGKVLIRILPLPRFGKL